MANAERLIEVFNEAKVRNAGVERERFLDASCQSEPLVRAQIVSLLEADAEEDRADFLRQTTLLRRALTAERPGDRIGRYKLLEQIGEGGCGVVYLAEQEEPVRRRLALKVIKLGMDTKQVVARFEGERQALALMDHPNIARVLDAGATEAGRPFFVMELVRGIKITDFCDQNQLSTKERLDLFIKVCNAIQHAHQKGIIHRDIKPSNILVTLHDGVPAPKVIDFGIAKATEGRLADATVYTQLDQFIGTPAYMSPEQAELTILDVDTRSDIYSLGVLLYELLTGKTPFDAERLAASGVDEIRRTIREQAPPKPSTRLCTLSDAEISTVAAHRHTQPPGLLHLLCGDLDWIVMKCLEKDRARRYETANGLATDIQRHLNCEPVVARPPSRLYEFQKTIRRHKFGFAAAAAVIGALAAGLSIASWAFLRERSARQQAEIAQNVARAESARNEQVATFLMDTISPDGWRGEEATLVRPVLLDFFAARLGNDLTNQPGAQGDLWLCVANSCAGTSDYARAVTNCYRAVEAYRQAFGFDHAKLALACSRLSKFQHLNGDVYGSRTNAQRAVSIARRCGDPETLADCLLEGAKSFSQSGRPAPEAIPWLREAMDLRRRVVPHLLALLDSTRLLVLALEDLAAEGNLDEAKTVLEEELKQDPSEGELLKLLGTFNQPKPGP